MPDAPHSRELTLTGTPLVVEGSRPPRPHVIEQIRGPGAPRRIELNGVQIVVGREGDISIPSAQISRTHLRLSRQGADYRCVDLESRNGVYLNGIRVHSAVLREGDRLQLGDVVFLYFTGSAP